MANHQRGTDEPAESAGPASNRTANAACATASPGETALPSDELGQLRQKAAERDEYLDLLQRVRADYVNYKKRVVKEIDSARLYGAQVLVLDLLAVMDNLERALQTAESGNNSTGLLDGIRMVHQQLQSALARHGLQPIAAEGQPFDPELHEALMEQPSADKPHRTVLQELQKGYRWHDRVVRPTRVVVSTAAKTDDSAAPATTGAGTNP
ncbi:MAG: nucleotide exchange factor GrpE [Planctomycetes bacterium]|nr:nucleotide exchange factor GrpE [Planctomycetota bacterium]